MNASLIEKYNISIPRYTSYPTVLEWRVEAPNEDEWIKHLKTSYSDSDGLSIYIHLPFCEQLCTYCGCNKRITKNHAVESPYIKAILTEWAIYRNRLGFRPTIKELHLGGGTPTFFSPAHLQELIRSIVNDCDIHTDYEFSFEAHPSSTSKDHLETLYSLGFRRISIGVQDISPTILRAINRKQTREEVIEVTQWAREIGYTSVNYDIIYGLPFQEQINIFDTLEFIDQQRPDRIAFYSYAHVPWKSASQRAFTIEDVPSGKYKSELYRLGRFILSKIGYKAVGMDHFCLPSDELYQAYHQKKMHRNFMGYTPRRTVSSIALGSSAISDSTTMYVQNEKTVEAYQDRLAEGQLPLVKGHILSSQELLIRQAILDLMCRDRLSWQENSLLHKTIADYLPNLSELIQDGLVLLKSNRIEVTDKGRYFIRNICAAIDPIYQKNKSTLKYSKAI